MIPWMSDGTKRILGLHEVEVVGFDVNNEEQAKSAWCGVKMDGVSAAIHLGDVRGLKNEEIDRRFAAAMFQFARTTFGGREAFKVADELLANINKEVEDAEEEER